MMTFIRAVQLIGKSKTLELCTDKTELNGIHHNICVYKGNEFVGKIHWPEFGNPATVDDCVRYEIVKERLEERAKKRRN